MFESQHPCKDKLLHFLLLKDSFNENVKMVKIKLLGGRKILLTLKKPHKIDSENLNRNSDNNTEED